MTTRQTAPEGVVSFEEEFIALLRIIILGGMRSCKIAAKRNAREFIVVVVIETTHFGNPGADGHFIGSPRGVLAGAPAIVHIVDIAHNGQPRKGRKAHGKEARQVAVLGAISGLGIEHEPNVVLFLQVHVHDQLLFIDFQAGKFV